MRRRHSLPGWLSRSRQISLSEVFGHSGFLLAGTAFLDPDILNLRLLSVASGAATLVFTYWHPVGHPLWLPFGWNVVFMAINGGYMSSEDGRDFDVTWKEAENDQQRKTQMTAMMQGMQVTTIILQ